MAINLRNSARRIGASADRAIEERVDRSHENGPRGEHRYPAASQTAAEQAARRERDELKQRLGSASGGARPRSARTSR